jgi:purine-nucleoside phosphorylase
LTSVSAKLEESLAVIRFKTSIRPKIGIILGSGLGGLAAEVEDSIAIPYHDIPHMPQLSAAGHAGEFMVGDFAGQPTVMMRGRAHLYEGHEPLQATYGVRLMHAMGADTLVVSNASGGINPRFRVGELVLMDSHINLMNRSGLQASEGDTSLISQGVVRRAASVYNPVLMQSALDAAHQLGFGLQRGTYLATLGPNYESRAEYRAFRRMGADMVGMSTVPETILAASLGMRVLAFSVITNMAAPDCLAATSHADVLVAAEMAQKLLVAILKSVLPANLV